MLSVAAEVNKSTFSETSQMGTETDANLSASWVVRQLCRLNVATRRTNFVAKVGPNIEKRAPLARTAVVSEDAASYRSSAQEAPGVLRVQQSQAVPGGLRLAARQVSLLPLSGFHPSNGRQESQVRPLSSHISLVKRAMHLRAEPNCRRLPGKA